MYFCFPSILCADGQLFVRLLSEHLAHFWYRGTASDTQVIHSDEQHTSLAHPSSMGKEAKHRRAKQRTIGI